MLPDRMLTQVCERWEAEQARYLEEEALVSAAYLVRRFLADLDALRIGTVGKPEAIWFTTEDIAIMLQVTPATVRTWCGAGRFDGAIRLDNGTWRIPAAPVDAFAAARSAQERSGSSTDDKIPHPI